ncbi:MAG: lipase maturation factor family protein [Bacillota bacterium]
MNSYYIASWVLGKFLAASYFIAFLSLATQVLGLYGKQGILSIDHLLNLLDKELGADRFLHFPSLFWFLSTDSTLNGVCLLGMTASSLAFLGFSQGWMFLLCWVLYLSFVSVGQIFLSFQWDSLLLELGFLGIFFAPLKIEWIPWVGYQIHPLILGLVWLLTFKLMFSSGVVKLTNKDASWKNLTALNYHFWTQPLPNPISYFFAKLPHSVLKACTAIMFFIELVVPFFIFVPGMTQMIAASLLIFLQILIIATGNFAFFNLITLGLCLSVVPDPFWLYNGSAILPTELSTSVACIVIVVILPAHIFWIYKTLFEKSQRGDFLLPYMRFIYPWRLSNPYGLFAVMTKSRPELILEGSMDGQTWQEYEFNFKPGNIHKAPPVIAPFQPRMDWQMWFASLEAFNENLWLQNLVTRLFQESKDVSELIAVDPFAGRAPQYLRLVKYDYTFSSFSDLRTKGQWWHRTFLGVYSPTFARDDF